MVKETQVIPSVATPLVSGQVQEESVEMLHDLYTSLLVMSDEDELKSMHLYLKRIGTLK